jgi:hypothetical protein
MNFQILPSGQLNLRGLNLKFIIQQAWLCRSPRMTSFCSVRVIQAKNAL